MYDGTCEQEIVYTVHQSQVLSLKSLVNPYIFTFAVQEVCLTNLAVGIVVRFYIYNIKRIKFRPVIAN